MFYGFAFAILVFVIIFQAWQAIERQKSWDSRESELLDRIMSRNYEVYVNAGVVRDQANRPPETAAFEEERGIPVM